MLVYFTSNMLKVLFQLFDLEKSEYRFSSEEYAQMALQRRYRKPSLNTSILCPYEEQQSSYEAQLDYYTNFIRNHDGWEFVNVYADEGITGTSTKHREGFK